MPSPTQRTSSRISLSKSQTSLGTGTCNTATQPPRQPLSNPGSNDGSGGPGMLFPARLTAEGDFPPDQATFDCILYLFYCEQHRRIAITNIERSRVVWLPFVAIAKLDTWERASEQGVARILGKQIEERIDGPSDGNQAQTGQEQVLPKYKMNLIHALRLQLAIGEFEVRLTQLVRIYPTTGYQCCQKTTALEWIEYGDALRQQLPAPLWGPEVWMQLPRLTKYVPARDNHYIFEMSHDNVLAYLTRPDKQSLFQGKLMRSCSVSTETVLALYEHFVQFCFPSFFLSAESFKMYLLKYGGYSATEQNDFDSLFRAVGYNHKGYVDFFEFLVGVFCLDPATDNLTEARLKMLGRYYALSDGKRLTSGEFIRLLKDLNPSMTEDHLTRHLSPLVRAQCKFPKTDRIPVTDLTSAIESGALKGTERLCRSPKSIVAKVLDFAKKKQMMSRAACEKDDKNSSSLMANRRDRGTCAACRAQNLTYTQHAVSLDVDGRCVNPAHIDTNQNDVDKNPMVMTEARYSAEYRFGSGSVANVFMDLLRKRADIAQEDYQYVRSLCESASEFFAVEDRLMKTNAPAFVIGDLCGSTGAMHAINQMMCPSLPVLQNNLIFLGNYIGGEVGNKNSTNLEVLCFVLMLKLQQPNKVLLLRGFNENGKDANRILMPECTRRYGPQIGPVVCQLFVDTFANMPFAVIVDESVLCVHSGIPKATSRLSTVFEDIPKVLHSVDNCFIAYELISKRPVESKSPTSSTGTTSSLLFTREQFQSFMAGNDLTHMIRGNPTIGGAGAAEPPPDYELYFDGDCITVNSAQANPMVAYLDPGKKLKCPKVADIEATIRLVKMHPDEE